MCNTKELFKLLNLINPDIIFEELFTHSFKEIHAGRMAGSMETDTIKLYLNNYVASHHPVDLDLNLFVDKQFKHSIKYMWEIFSQYPHYLELRQQVDAMAYKFGFPFLNNVQCDALLAKIYFLEIELAETYNQGELTKIHRKWVWINDKRERHMIENIYKYSKDNQFENAVFLVGAEHRKPIIDIINNEFNNSKKTINWNFEYFNSWDGDSPLVKA